MPYLPPLFVQEWIQDHPLLALIAAVPLLILVIKLIIWHFRLTGDGRISGT